MKYIIKNSIVFVVFLIIITNYSCTKHEVSNEPPLTYSPNPQTTVGTGSVSFWVSNIYGDEDDYVYYHIGFFKVIAGGSTQTIFYTLKDGSTPSCNEPKAVTFNLGAGTHLWKLVDISGNILIKQGTVSIGQGQCVVEKISF